MDRPDAGDSFLTVAEVAEMLKLNQQTVRNWIDQGSLPALRVGRLVRIRRSDFERLISGGGTAGSADGQSQSAQDFWDGEPVGVADLVCLRASRILGGVGYLEVEVDAADPPPLPVHVPRPGVVGPLGDVVDEAEEANA